MTIEENINARTTAEAAFEILSELINDDESLSAVTKARAWNILGGLVDDVTGLRKIAASLAGNVEPMSDQEAKEFENQPMPFGKFGPEPNGLGLLIRDVPLKYLLYIEERPDFKKDLTRYLKRPEVQREQESSSVAQ